MVYAYHARDGRRHNRVVCFLLEIHSSIFQQPFRRQLVSYSRWITWFLCRRDSSPYSIDNPFIKGKQQYCKFEAWWLDAGHHSNNASTYCSWAKIWIKALPFGRSFGFLYTNIFQQKLSQCPDLFVFGWRSWWNPQSGGRRRKLFQSLKTCWCFQKHRANWRCRNYSTIHDETWPRVTPRGSIWRHDAQPIRNK